MKYLRLNQKFSKFCDSVLSLLRSVKQRPVSGSLDDNSTLRTDENKLPASQDLSRRVRVLVTAHAFVVPFDVKCSGIFLPPTRRKLSLSPPLPSSLSRPFSLQSSWKPWIVVHSGLGRRCPSNGCYFWRHRADRFQNLIKSNRRSEILFSALSQCLFKSLSWLRFLFWSSVFQFVSDDEYFLEWHILWKRLVEAGIEPTI